MSTPATTAWTPTGSPEQLALGTGAFTVCFAVFGSISAMMPILKGRLHLSPMEVSIALAMPVLLGSLGRIPLGILTDRYGGRRMFIIVMASAVVAGIAAGFADSYSALLVAGFFVGIGLASFSVGTGFVSPWYPAERQGAALGIYGAGNVGQSLAAYGAPVIVAALGYSWGFHVYALLAVLWLTLFIWRAHDAPVRKAPVPLSATLALLRQPKSWALSAFYFLTFGGFVAMSIYLPTLLTDQFQLTGGDAGRRTAGFVLLATAMRPIGGVLADKVGGRRVLNLVFPVTALFALLMISTSIVPFTIGALGVALAIGVGNGAVLKLAPEYFPTSVGAITGLVGAAGGLGGFFPPLVLGVMRSNVGSYAPGFVLLCAVALTCSWICLRLGRGDADRGGLAVKAA